MVTINFGMDSNPSRMKVKTIEDKKSITFDPSKLWSWLTDKDHPAPDGQDRESKAKQAKEDAEKERQAKAEKEAEAAKKGGKK